MATVGWMLCAYVLACLLVCFWLASQSFSQSWLVDWSVDWLVDWSVFFFAILEFSSTDSSSITDFFG